MEALTISLVANGIFFSLFIWKSIQLWGTRQEWDKDSEGWAERFKKNNDDWSNLLTRTNEDWKGLFDKLKQL